MLNSAVSTGNTAVARMISGFLAMSLDHPFVLCLIVSAMAGSACAVLLDALAAPQRGRTGPPDAAPRARRVLLIGNGGFGGFGGFVLYNPGDLSEEQAHLYGDSSSRVALANPPKPTKATVIFLQLSRRLTSASPAAK